MDHHHHQNSARTSYPKKTVSDFEAIEHPNRKTLLKHQCWRTKLPVKKGTKSIKNEHPTVLIAWFSVMIGPEQFMLWSLSTSKSMDINSQGHSYSRFFNYPLWSCSNLWKDRKNHSVVPYVKIQNLTTTETKTVTSYLKEIFKSTTPSTSIMEETLFNHNARSFSTRFHSQKVWIPSRSQKVLNGLVKFHLRTEGWPC